MSDVLTIIVSIVVFILIFSILILVHEFGHFWMAKRAGVRVDEFGFGLPPRIWGKKKGDTLYSLNAIPFGGFVRLYGEDPSEFRAEKAKDSFITQGLWNKTKIVCGGVFMNFLLAWVLLTFGLLVGMEPLIVNYDQFETYLKDGHITISPFTVFEESNEELGVVRGDRVLEIDGKSIDDIGNIEAYVEKKEDGIKAKVRAMNIPESEELDGYYSLPGSIDRVKSFSVEEFKTLSLASQVRLARLIMNTSNDMGLEAGDVILRVNGDEVIGRDDFFAKLYMGHVESIDVLRRNLNFNIQVDRVFTQTRIDRILPESPAMESGLMKGDIIKTINGVNVFAPEQVRATTQRIATQTNKLTYVVKRGDTELEFEIEPDMHGLIGIAMSPQTITGETSFDFYETFVSGSVLDVEKERFSLFRAPFEALIDIKDMALLTGQMIAGVFGGVLSSGEIPDGVAGPVGIAQMTYLSVQNGFMDVVRFAAILSLSLGVLNILPFPALDGGRFAFILFEAVTGKKVGHKFEAMIHAIGFAVLLLLIILITWNDFVRLFAG